MKVISIFFYPHKTKHSQSGRSDCTVAIRQILSIFQLVILDLVLRIILERWYFYLSEIRTIEIFEAIEFDSDFTYFNPKFLIFSGSNNL